jgi:hypothetical protein
MIESMIALIGVLVIKVGKDVATNLENRIINAAIDVANQKQQPQLSELNFGIRTLQKNQDEIKANQIRDIKAHYKNGIDFIRYANTSTDNEQKKHFIYNAIDSFTYASNIEVGEAHVNATVLVGACFYALRLIDNTTSVALENGQYDKAFQLAEKIPGPAPQTPYPRLYMQSSFRLPFSSQPPSRELIEQLLKLPYLQQKYGTIDVYWKKWAPPKQVEAPKFVGTQRSQLPIKYGFASQFNQRTIRKTCQRCHKQYNESTTAFYIKNYCPECRSKYP